MNEHFQRIPFFASKASLSLYAVLYTVEQPTHYKIYELIHTFYNNRKLYYNAYTFTQHIKKKFTGRWCVMIMNWKLN